MSTQTMWKCLRWIAIYALVMVFVAAAILVSGCDNRKCLKGHTYEDTHPGFMMPMFVGTSMIPIWYPGYTDTHFVCDVYEGEQRR